MKDEHILILCGFLDTFSVSIIITSLPLHLKSFDVSTTLIGCFYSLYGALQIPSSYLMGYLADKVGKRVVICICAFFTAIGYFALGWAPSFFLIFMLRFISGLFKQTQNLSRTILGTRSVQSGNDRLILLGRFSAFSSAGFILGPSIGGYVYQKYGFFSIGCLSGFGFILMTLMFLTLDQESIIQESQNLYVPPQSNSPQIEKGNDVRQRIKSKVQDVVTTNNEHSHSLVDEDNTWSIFRKTWDMLLCVFILSFCPLLFRTNYSLVLRELFQSTSILSGFASSSGAVTGSLAGLVAPMIVRFYQNYYDKIKCEWRTTQLVESRLLFHTSFILALSFFGCSMVPSLTLFILFQLPVSFVNGIAREAFNMAITKRVSKDKIGRVMGMSGSLVSFGRLIAPIFGSLLQELSYRLPILFSSVLSFFATWVIYNYFDAHQKYLIA